MKIANIYPNGSELANNILTDADRTAWGESEYNLQHLRTVTDEEAVELERLRAESKTYQELLKEIAGRPGVRNAVTADAPENIKFVTLMRTDLNMRKGKMIAQGQHASVMFLIDRLTEMSNEYHAKLPVHELEWMKNGMKKICLGIDSQAELLEIADKAKAAKLTCHVITDRGDTEFHGIPTVTCLAIGPHPAEKIDPITGHLKPL